ncbi:hypothetical protein KPL40_11815 [Clostridium gasigenes]|uniref:cohesin domain-containing protein n=1 Tax=Clostridium gasigenes TaxID=94869 RepID=UPI001C0CCA3D|nr:cohesin domain-containing protein [Clostridium gasigenes]MBU3133137.1 hypothetical protein [Clostridium gasigenes]
MKKILGLLIVLGMAFSTTVFAAGEPQVSFTVDGKVEKGEKITINIMAKDVSNLYTLSAHYIYNPEFIKVSSIEGGSLIKDSKYNLMEPGGQTDKDGNRANYQMTFVGEVNGVSGSGAIVKIEAEVLKDFTIELTEENMKVELVKVDKNYNVDRMSFVFNSFKIEGNTENSGSTGETTGSTSNKEKLGETSGETPSEENTNAEVTASEETESETAKPSFIEKIMNIFKKEPKVKESSNASEPTNGKVKASEETESETSKPSLIKKIMNIFKKEPQVEESSNVSESTNVSDENKDAETISDNGEISKADNEEYVNNDENIKVDNKQDVASKSSALPIVLTTSIVVIAIGGIVTLVIRKKYNNKTGIEDKPNEK